MPQCLLCGGMTVDEKAPCPHCGGETQGAPANAFANSQPLPLSESPSAETQEESGAIYDLLRGRIFFWIVLMILCGLLSAAALFFAIRQQWVLNERSDRAVAERFQDEKVQTALRETAQRYGQEILKSQMDPALLEFQKKIAETERYLDEMKIKLEEKYRDLARQSALLDERKIVANLTEQAMRGYRRSYDQLAAYGKRKEPEGISRFANEALERVENYYRYANRLEGIAINFMDENGQGWINERVPTRVLLRDLRESPAWRIRAKAAQLLQDRPEPGVAEALLEAADTDPYLDIVKYALESFAGVTGYDGVEVFGVSKAREWWAEFGKRPRQLASGPVEVSAVDTVPSGWKAPSSSVTQEARYG